MCHHMHYVKATQDVQSVAELILNSQKHTCGPDCLCWELRQVPAISDAMRRLHVQKLQGRSAESS
jgi:hypothetical protein